MKKNRELLNIIGDIDDDMIEKAKPDTTKKKISVWPGILSTAAVLAVIAGLQYRFVFMPLADGRKNNIPAGNAVTEAAESRPVTSVQTVPADEWKVTEPAESGIKTSVRTVPADMWKMKKIRTGDENNIVRELYTRDDGNLWVRYDGVYSSGCMTAEYEGIRYDFNGIIEGSVQNGPLNVCVSDDHIFIHYANGLYSAEKSSPDKVYSVSGENFYSEMNLGGETRMLGADTSGNVYTLNREYSDRGIGFRLFCYSPDLKIQYRETSPVFEMDSIFNGDVIPGIFDTATGFDEIHITDSNLEITYGGNCVIRYSFESGEYSSDMNFETEYREVSAENGVYRNGWYTEAENENGVNTLKMCTYRIIDNADNHDRTEDGRKIFTCFDTEAYAGSEELMKPFSRSENYDRNGNRLSDVEYGSEESDSENTEKYNFSDAPETLAASGFTEDNVFGLSPQKDGTLVFISENSLYMADVSGEVTKICMFDREYITSERIVKIDDTHYALPSSSFESSRDHFWILEKPE